MPPLPLARIPLALLVCALLPIPPLGAQETESPLSPAGRLRIDVVPRFLYWEAVYTEAGEVPLGRVVEAERAVSLFPGADLLQREIADLLDQPGYVPVLGSTRAWAGADQVRVPLRIDLGVTDRLTVGTTVPFVKSRTEMEFAYVAPDGGAGVGLSPALADPSAALAYLGEVQAAATAAGALARQRCATDPQDASCERAQELEQAALGLGAGLATIWGGSALFPTEGSAAGLSLRTLASELDVGLREEGLDGLFTLPLPLATPVQDLAGFEESVLAPLGLPGFGTRAPGWELGDVEVHAAVRLLGSPAIARAAPADGDAAGGDAVAAAQVDAGRPASSLQWEVGAGALLRLGTGVVDEPSTLFDVGSGDGQTDVEGRLFGEVRARRWAVWGDARYGVQLAGERSLRLGPPELPFLPGPLVPVEIDPGDYLEIEIAPRYHLTDELAIAAGWRYRTEGEPTYTRVGEPVMPETLPPVFFTDAAVLGATGPELSQLGGALVFNTVPAWRAGRTPLPFEARLSYRTAIGGSGGAPAASDVRFGLRVYTRLWGR